MESRIGEQFDAIVTGASDKGTWARLLAMPVEGKVVRGFEGVDVGDRIHVQLIAVDVERGYIDFRKVGSSSHYEDLVISEVWRMSQRRMKAKLIFNPSAGAARASPVQILDVIHEMQAWKLVPEAFLVEPGCDLPGVVQDALAQGIRMFVVCGGDGTISAVARTLASTPPRATLGIIPIGTQNNTALSLGIPADIPAAIAILRTGRRIKVDVGVADCGSSSSRSSGDFGTGGESSTPFLEVCSVGLVSTLFPSADDIQHGDLARVGDFLATLVSFSARRDSSGTG